MRLLVIISLVCVSTACISGEAFSQSPLLARSILVEKYKLFNETPEFKKMLSSLESVLSQEWNPQQKPIIINTIFINACNFSLLRTTNSKTAVSDKPKLEAQDLFHSTVTYDTLLTKPCVTADRLKARRIHLSDYFLFVSDVDKLRPLVRKRGYKTEDLVDASKFYDLYESVVPTADKFPRYKFLHGIFKSDFFKIEGFLDYLRVNIVLQLEDNTVNKNADEIGKMFKFKLN